MTRPCAASNSLSISTGTDAPCKALGTREGGRVVISAINPLRTVLVAASMKGLCAQARGTTGCRSRHTRICNVGETRVLNR